MEIIELGVENLDC